MNVSIDLFFVLIIVLTFDQQLCLRVDDAWSQPFAIPKDTIPLSVDVRYKGTTITLYLTLEVTWYIDFD